MENEIWRPIKGYEGLYEVSNLGRVKSLERKKRMGYCYGLHTIKEKILTQYSSYEYMRVTLWKECKSKHFQVHRLVADAFLIKPDGDVEVDHIDGNKSNNNVSNLRWVTHYENIHNPVSMERKKRNYRVGKQKEGGLSHKAKKVVAVNMETGEILKFDAMVEATGFLDNKISACVRGKSKFHRGYKWYYEEDYNKINSI